MDINQNPNEFKIKLAFDLLTPEEINQLNFRVTKTISELNKKEILAVGKTFGLKIGMSFEDNDPKKYVYYQLGVTIVDKPNETQDNCFYNFFIEDIDVYDFDTKADWFDKVADTKQEKNGVENVFYEDQFFQTIQNKDYDPDKILADNPELEKMVDTLVQELIAPPCSTNIVYESPSIQEEQKKEKEEPTTISKEELFDFHDPEQVFTRLPNM